MHRLESESQPLRLGLRIASALKDLRLTAKEIALLTAKTGNRLDLRTVQNAMGGSCSLDTYDVLIGTFGWEFEEKVMTPRVGASRIETLEQEIERERAEVAAREAYLARLKSACEGAPRNREPLRVVAP
jgi:hypothetical protein